MKATRQADSGRAGRAASPEAEVSHIRGGLVWVGAVFALLFVVSLFLTSGGGAAAPAFGPRTESTALQPVTITLQQGKSGYLGTSDTYLYAYEPDRNYGLEGALKLRSGTHHPLVRFDTSSLPAGAEVLTATLELYAYDADRGSEVDVEVYQVLRSWVETEATWRGPQSGEIWVEAGCRGSGTDRSAAPSTIQTLDGVGRWHGFDVTDTVRDWAAGGDNYGFVVVPAPGSAVDTYYFRSADHPTGDQQPRLVIVHVPDSVTPTPTTLLPSATHTEIPDTTATPSPSPTLMETAVSIRTPVPNSVYAYPEQRVGAVAFGTVDLEVSRLHVGLVKLEDRGPRAAERELGVDFITVLRVGPGWCVPTDPADWQSCQADIAQLVAANPGHWWFIGNEPENPCRPGAMHSSEYAQTYHIVYHFIKGQDPTAKVGIGGVVIPSKARRDWLDNVLHSYRGLYGEPMPVDVWNIHNLLLSECPDPLCRGREQSPCPELWCSGGYLPPEFGCDPSRRTWRSQESQANATEFKQLIREFRAWMATREEARDKPLIITEMGVFAPRTDAGGPFPHELINQFMSDTFDFMINERDSEIGYSLDDDRLVQAWTWYALHPTGDFYGYLFEWDGSITDFGVNLANYTARFLPASPTTIFFQRGWTGYTEDTDTWIAPDGADDTGFSLLVGSDSNHRALLKFDVSILPTNVEVISATLSLRSAAHQGDDMTVACYGLKRPWEVAEASWTHATDTTPWEVPGATGASDREVEAASEVWVDANDATYVWDVTHLARQWVANPSANYGVLLEGEAGTAGRWRFISSDQPENPPWGFHRLRPKLELLVRLPEPPPTPTATPTVTGTLPATATGTATLTPTATPTVGTTTMYLPIIVKGS
ncbi:MAG: hypothetical protein AMJ93_04660 [Anaerolineae bacterium SM23_84]|nr:MAG: hypothetical protein AMJ93_04660 [Anaerolineae bacterium SM23_84]